MSSLLSTAAACLAIWVLWKAYHKFRSSPLDNIAGPPSTSFVKGNFAQFFGNNAREYQIELLKKYGNIVKLKFAFGENVLLVSDPKALHVIVKDQHTFEGLHSFLVFTRVVFGPGLLATTGEQHRKHRKILNPVFSATHLKEMVPNFYNVVYKLRETIAHKVKEGPQEVDLLSWMSRTALELIGQSGFGYSFDGLTEDFIPHPFATSLKRSDAVTRRPMMFFARVNLLPILSRIGTPKLQNFVVRLLPWKALREIVEVVDTLHKTSVDIIKSRKVALQAGKEAMDRQVARGKDIMSILLQANEQANAHDRLSDEEVVGQITTFTVAAMSTTASALARTLWVLSQRQDAQDRLRLEIREARKGQEDLAYDELMNLPYLDAICRETLRLYPPIVVLGRTAHQDGVLPLGTPIKGVNGTEINEIFVPKGTNIRINVTACNTDPEIWGPDSLEWKPERWLQPLPDSVSSAHIPGVFSNMMTFLGGNRSCIGFKFSLLEMKVVLLLLVESFKFSLPSDKEIYWQTQGIAKPSVVGSSDFRLPLVVERAET